MTKSAFNGELKVNEAIVDSVHKIANHIYKASGYLVTIKRGDVATVLEAYSLLNDKIEEENNGQNGETGNTEEEGKV